LSWLEVISVFLGAAFLSVNGSTTLALLEEDLVRRFRLLDPQQFATGVSIGAASPGPFGWGSISLGFLADGWRGALVALFTSWIPAFLAIPLRAGYRRLEAFPWMAGAGWGVGAAGSGLFVGMAYSLAETGVSTPIQAAITGVALLALLFGASPLLVLLLAAGAGGILLQQ